MKKSSSKALSSDTKPCISKEELSDSFAGTKFGPVLNVALFAELVIRSESTVYDWIAKGRLKNAARKRGHTTIILRDLAMKILMCDPEWESEEVPHA